ncbi:MAG: hypothetical protein E6G06_00630 [Actinobacteria bacterium]|nr:MAG: hypothetical protein E6G06_00630 [Actinomycetota bacterium]
MVRAACREGTVYFAASRGSLLLGNLERHAAIAMTVADRDHDLTIQGDAERVGIASAVPNTRGPTGALSTRPIHAGELGWLPLLGAYRAPLRQPMTSPVIGEGK